MLNVLAVLAFLGMNEFWIIAGVILLLFGAKKLPELARSMGSSVTQFKKGLKEGGESSSGSDGDPPPERLAEGEDDRVVGDNAP